ncbi:MAG: hypothetical protein DU489_10800 [Nitrosomonas sp.]|uniref:hypothetical protein n=1 Tax=Nitrosomonas sp. TaxID=42353 RepID=UPI0032EF7979
MNSQIQTDCWFLFCLMWLLSWSCAVIADAPEAKQMSESGPAIESQAVNQSENSQGTTEQSLFHVRIVQSKEEAANTEARERSTSQHEQEDLKAQIRSADAAEKQVVLTGWAVTFSAIGILGLLGTIWLTRSSVQQAARSADAANANAASLISAERAYVKMSILDPGVQWRNDDRQFYVQVEVKNFGRTPATVTDTRVYASIREHGDLLPTEFPYPPRGEEARHTGFLVPGEDFSFEKHFPMAKSSPRQDSSKRLWIFGHVDYIALGNRYRFGFARLYEPVLDGGKRNIMTVTEGRYDFDRERKSD